MEGTTRLKILGIRDEKIYLTVFSYYQNRRKSKFLPFANGKNCVKDLTIYFYKWTEDDKLID